MNRRLAEARMSERGQSLVEVALALPMLLLILLGIVDIGRLYAFKTATTNAAREAALYAARDATALTDDLTLPDGTVVVGICHHARDELGMAATASPCSTAPVTIACLRGGQPCGNDASSPRLFQTYGAGGAGVTVTVTYNVSLLTGYLIGTVFRVNPVPVSATAAFAGLGQ